MAIVSGFDFPLCIIIVFKSVVGRTAPTYLINLISINVLPLMGELRLIGDTVCSVYLCKLADVEITIFAQIKVLAV